MTMPDEEFFAFEADGTVHEVTVTPKRSPVMEDGEFEDYDLMTEGLIAKMQKTRQLIRTCTLQSLAALRDLPLGEVEEVNLKFGIKLGGKAGLPYITEGSAESNLEISVKCKYPKQAPTP